MVLKPCLHPNCPQLVPTVRKSNRRSYCDEHLGEVQSANRSRYPRNYYGETWNAIRRSHLRKFPSCHCSDTNCGVCSGNHLASADVPATEVDHLVRFKEWQRKESAHKWLVSLCKQCHSSK